MDELEARIHRTWVQLLVDSGYSEIAAIAIESEIEPIMDFDFNESWLVGFVISIPSAAYALVNQDEQMKKVIQRSILSTVRGHYGQSVQEDQLKFIYRVKLLDIEEGWVNIIKNLIANGQNPNQATITEKIFTRDNKQPYSYNEMKFASKSEIRIAQELENRNILFFPLPLAVRAETRELYKDHREPDFLICNDGVWGILEVSYHPDRYEKDKEKDAWFKKSGILCVEHHTAERCFNEPSKVVDEFLSILAQHK